MPRKARINLSAEERRLQILHAAIKVFARSNYRVAGTADIAHEAGIAEPTIYKYFPSKKDLFVRILNRIGNRILEIWQPIAAEEPDAMSVLRRIGSIYLESLRTHSDDLKIQFQALAESDDPEIGRQLRQNHEAYVRFFTKLIERGKREGVIRADADPYAAGWFLNGFGFTLTLVNLLHFDQKVGEQRVEKMINGYLDWLAGVGGRPVRRQARHR